MLSVIVPLATTPYIARVLGAENLGDYSYAFSVVTYFNLFGLLGINTYGQIKVAAVRDDEEKLSRTFWEINICRVISMFASILVFGVLITNSVRYRQLYEILVIYLFANMLDISWFFQGLENFKVCVIRNSLVKICSLILVFIFVKTKQDLYVYALILQLSTLLGNITFWPYISKLVKKIRIREVLFWRNWKEAFVYFVPTVATTIYTVLDKSMLEWIVGSAEQNGFYDQAHKIEQILVVALLSIKVVFFPRLVNLFNTGRENEARNMILLSNRAILLLACPMTMGTLAISDYIVPLFLGEGYEPCILLLNVFSILFIVQGLDTSIGFTCLTATGKQKYFNGGVLLGALVNFFANIILINCFKSVGAAVASVIAETVILGVFLYYGREYIDLKILFRWVSRYLCAAIIMYFTISGLKNFLECNWWTIAIMIVLGMGVYFGILVLGRDDIVFETLKKYVVKFRRKV